MLVKRNRRTLFPDIKSWDGVDLMVTAGKVKAEWDNTKLEHRPVSILIDVIGLGAGVVDRLRELHLPIRAVNVSESPAEDRFLNKRAELWWMIRQWLEAKDVALPNPERGVDPKTDALSCLYRELVTPKYTFSSRGQIKLESKEEFKKRMQDGRSPDYADAFALTFAENLSLMTYGRDSSSYISWDKPLNRDTGVV